MPLWVPGEHTFPEILNTIWEPPRPQVVDALQHFHCNGIGKLLIETVDFRDACPKGWCAFLRLFGDTLGYLAIAC